MTNIKAKKVNSPAERAALQAMVKAAGAQFDVGGFRFSKDVAAQHKAVRDIDLATYVLEVFGHRAAQHHLSWLERITAVLEGRSPKQHILLIAPPGTAKSTYVSHSVPPWHLGRNPDQLILAVTASDVQAHRFHTVVRDTLEGSAAHVSHYPHGRPDPKRGWSNDGLYLDTAPPGNPSYRCVGFGTNILGSRADVIILDDPLTEEESRSTLIMEKSIEYLDRTIDSRLRPTTGHIIAIMTRWSEADLAAYLMSRGDFEVIVMPALTPVEAPPSDEFDIAEWQDDATKWESIWPSYFPVQWYLDKWATIGTPTFGCVYQCDPTALGGGIFGTLRGFPEGVSFDGMFTVIYADLAFSEKAAADYTAIVVDTYSPRPPQTHYIRAVYKAQLTELGVENLMVDLIERWQPQAWAVEDNNFKTRDVQRMVWNIGQRSRMQGQGIPVDKDKVLRARTPAARSESGFLFVDRGAPWFQEFEMECRAFPNGQHDDQVDALSGAVALAEDAVGLYIPPSTYTIRGGRTPAIRGFAADAQRAFRGA